MAATRPGSVENLRGGSGKTPMTDPLEALNLPQASRVAKERQQEILKDFEMRRKVQATVVPTDPVQVKNLLRSLDEPITLFGEREMERRERLKRIVAERGVPLTSAHGASGQDIVVEVSKDQKELFYTEGAEALVLARKEIASWSLMQAKNRIGNAKRKREAGEDVVNPAVMKVMGSTASESSEIAGVRPVNCAAFSPDSKAVLTAGWSGEAKVWSVPACKMKASFLSHQERCTGVAWHPHATQETSTDTLSLATGSADATVKLWTNTGKLLKTLEGHTDRLARVAFHPMGKHLATASFDTTWRLWDVSTGVSLLEQEGHSRAVYSVVFQCDGALAASGGLDAIGRVWDCRTGQSIMTLQGHVKKVLTMDFAPNGYTLASGSDDNTCRIWDLRKRQSMYTIPAHTLLISCVKFDPVAGDFILTTAFDKLAKIWSGKDYSLIKVLAGHEGKIMDADVASDGSSRFITVGYDRTLKYWGPQPEDEVDDAVMDE